MIQVHWRSHFAQFLDFGGISLAMQKRWVERQRHLIERQLFFAWIRLTGINPKKWCRAFGELQVSSMMNGCSIPYDQVLSNETPAKLTKPITINSENQAVVAKVIDDNPSESSSMIPCFCEKQCSITSLQQSRNPTCWWRDQLKGLIINIKLSNPLSNLAFRWKRTNPSTGFFKKHDGIVCPNHPNLYIFEQLIKITWSSDQFQSENSCLHFRYDMIAYTGIPHSELSWLGLGLVASGRGFSTSPAWTPLFLADRPDHHPSIHPSMHPSIHPSIHASCIHSFIHPFLPSFIHLFIISWSLGFPASRKWRCLTQGCPFDDKPGAKKWETCKLLTSNPAILRSWQVSEMFLNCWGFYLHPPSILWLPHPQASHCCLKSREDHADDQLRHQES